MAVFVNDTFTDTDGTLAQAHDGELNADWGLHPSYGVNAEVASNRMRCVTTTGSTAYFNSHASGDPPSADYDVDFVVFQNAALNASSAAGVCGRMNTAANTFYLPRFLGTGNWQLFKFLAGTPTQLGSDVPDTIGIGNSKAAKLRMEGDQIGLWVPSLDADDPIILVTDSAITAPGEVGLRLARQEVHLDSISASTIAAPSSNPMRMMI